MKKMKGNSTKATGGKPRGSRPVTGSTSAGRYGPGGNGTPKKRRR